MNVVNYYSPVQGETMKTFNQILPLLVIPLTLIACSGDSGDLIQFLNKKKTPEARQGEQRQVVQRQVELPEVRLEEQLVVVNQILM